MVIKSRKMSATLVRMGNKNAYKILVGKPKAKKRCGLDWNGSGESSVACLVKAVMYFQVP